MHHHAHRFLVFTGATYYPVPGWRGFRGSFATQAEAEASIDTSIKKSAYDWWQVVDLLTQTIVAGGGQGHAGLGGYVPAKDSKNVGQAQI